jgi:hypothetical protein
MKNAEPKLRRKNRTVKVLKLRNKKRLVRLVRQKPSLPLVRLQIRKPKKLLEFVTSKNRLPKLFGPNLRNGKKVKPSSWQIDSEQ